MDTRRAEQTAEAIEIVGVVLDLDGVMAILAEYNTRCDPPWSERDLRHKAEDALRKATCQASILDEAD